MNQPQGLLNFFSTSAVLLASRLGGAGLTVLTQLILARIVPVETLGVFFLATSTASVLALLATFGFPNISNRILSRYRVSHRPECAASYVKTVCLTVTIAGLVFAVGGLSWIHVMADANTSAALSVGISIVPIIALSFFLGSALNAEREFIWASMPELLLRPLGFLTVLLFFVACGVVPSAVMLVVVFCGFCLFTLVLQTVKARSVFTGFLTASPAPRRIWQQWSKMASPLIAVSLFTNLFADVAIVFSGAFLEKEVLAPLAIAIKLSLLFGFFVQIIHQQILPDLSDAVRRQEYDTYTTRLSHANRWAVAATAFATVLVALFGEQILSLFGSAYAQASTALTVLVACQLIRAFCGPAAQLLVVINRQRIVLATTTTTLVLFGMSVAALIPVYGTNGAIAAICMSIIMWNALNAVALSRFTGLSSHLCAWNFWTKLGSTSLVR